MRCYKCNNVLSDNDYCLKCGADVSAYKLVVRASNSYYNTGLARVKVRDLSGAVPALRTSLELNKKNTKARNLLGLVYYEMGEVACAISEWVISVNYKPERNIAESYIHKVKSNPNRLEALNQAAKKYNLALRKAKDGEDDVALIQLKKIAANHPKFIRANNLLALLYMKKGEDEKALKLVGRVLKIDRSNTVALKYLDELTGSSGQHAVSDGGEADRTKRKSGQPVSGNDVILPKTSYKEPSSGVFTVVYILLGIIIGVALVWFLVVPAKLQSAQHENNEVIKSYSEQLAGYSIDITKLENDRTRLEKQLEAANDELAALKGDTGEAVMYAKLIDAVSAYVDADYDEAVLALAQIDVTQLPTDKAKALYTTMEENCSNGAAAYYIDGVNAYNRKNYTDAAAYLERAFNMDGTTVETPYYLAMSYLELNDLEKAQTYIDIIHNDFGDSEYAARLDEYIAAR
ncbi:MAG: tetratricopeptide repeat protein [Butyrivibrio sp.]|nr:tetratricopeptide repeat protein [Butyrivibrio sp.]